MVGPVNCAQDVRAGSRPKEISYGAATSLLRGHAFDALENHGRALRCYRAALLADPRCYEAFRVRACGPAPSLRTPEALGLSLCLTANVKIGVQALIHEGQYRIKVAAGRSHGWQGLVHLPAILSASLWFRSGCASAHADPTSCCHERAPATTCKTCCAWGALK